MSILRNPKPKTENKKVRFTFIALLGLVLVTVAVWLSVGLGGKLVGDYREQNFIKTTHGVASSESELDPHIKKIQAEYKKVIDTAKANNPDGIYERIYAGDYAYEKLTADEMGQYTIEASIIFSSDETAKKVYSDILTQLKIVGYEQDEKVTPTETNADLLRMFVAADEQSAGSPGNDLVTLGVSPSGDGLKSRITFFYQGTETPLGGLPNGSENYKVSEYEELIKKVSSGELNICDYEPNGAVGGWYPEYSCQKDYL